jgi:hypothetical protein
MPRLSILQIPAARPRRARLWMCHDDYMRLWLVEARVVGAQEPIVVRVWCCVVNIEHTLVQQRHATAMRFATIAGQCIVTRKGSRGIAHYSHKGTQRNGANIHSTDDSRVPPSQDLSNGEVPWIS